jgi:hypothetical protein
MDDIVRSMQHVCVVCVFVRTRARKRDFAVIIICFHHMYKQCGAGNENEASCTKRGNKRTALLRHVSKVKRPMSAAQNTKKYAYLDCVRRLNIKGDGFPRERLHKNLHGGGWFYPGGKQCISMMLLKCCGRLLALDLAFTAHSNALVVCNLQPVRRATLQHEAC